MADSDERPGRGVALSLVGQVFNLSRQFAKLPYKVVRWVGGLRQWDTGGSTRVSDLAPMPPSVVIEPPATQPPPSQAPDGPPAHWVAQVQGSGPPADWLARVQQGAPQLLEAMARGAAFTLPPRAAKPPGAATRAEDGTSPSRPVADPALPVTPPVKRDYGMGHREDEGVNRRATTAAPREAPSVPNPGRPRAAKLEAVPTPLPERRTLPEVNTSAPAPRRPGRGQAAPLVVASAQPPRPVEPGDMPTYGLRAENTPSALVTPGVTQRPLMRPAPHVADEIQPQRRVVVPVIDDGAVPIAYRSRDSRQVEPDVAPGVPRPWANLAPPSWAEPAAASSVRPADAPLPQPRLETRAGAWAEYDAETQGRWPTLPLDDQPTAEDGEAARRSQARRQRLDREQAGQF